MFGARFHRMERILAHSTIQLPPSPLGGRGTLRSERKMKQRGVWFLMIFLIVPLLLAPVYGQKITGTISGSVTDPTGAMVPDATVTITNAETGLVRTTTTNSAGDYSAPDLPPGTYKVVIRQANFKESITKNVELHVSS